MRRVSTGEVIVWYGMLNRENQRERSVQLADGGFQFILTFYLLYDVELQFFDQR